MNVGYTPEENINIVREVERKYQIDLKDRLLKFAIDIIKFLFLLPFIKEMEVIRFQLSKSGTSIGANYSPSQIA